MLRQAKWWIHFTEHTHTHHSSRMLMRKFGSKIISNCFCFTSAQGVLCMCVINLQTRAFSYTCMSGWKLVATSVLRYCLCSFYNLTIFSFIRRNTLLHVKWSSMYIESISLTHTSYKFISLTHTKYRKLCMRLNEQLQWNLYAFWCTRHTKFPFKNVSKFSSTHTMRLHIHHFRRPCFRDAQV